MEKCCIFAHSWRYLIAFQLFSSLKLNHNTDTPVGFCYSPSCKICVYLDFLFTTYQNGIITYTIACMAKHMIMTSNVPSEILPPNFVDRSSNFCSSIIFCAFTDWKFYELEPLKTLLSMPMPLHGWQVNGIPLNVNSWLINSMAQSQPLTQIAEGLASWDYCSKNTVGLCVPN